MKKKYKIKIIIFLIIIFYIWLNLYINWVYSKKIYNYEEVPFNQVWLILWAWVTNWYLSLIYQDRLKIASKAYKKWKIQKILISGDNSKTNYDELTPAWKFLIDLWVKKEDIFLDYAGFDTYQSLFRSKYIFKADNINIFTQEYHLKRALYLCSKLKLNCNWVKTDKREYLYMNKYIFRETLANLKAFYNTFLWNKKPKYLWEIVDINLKSNFN